jgi:dipeptidyl aminopeptidase/acylaminoacyl peptidase
MDLKSDKHEPAIQADWDVMFLAFSERGKYRVSGVNEDARTVIHVLDTASGKEVKLPEVPLGDITTVTISPSESKMAFLVNGDTSPSNLYVLDLASGKLQQLTQTLNPAIKQDDLVTADVVRYQSFDGLEIPALLYRPWSASPSAKVPAIVSVHGGPGGQSRRGYTADVQYLVNHGYAVLRVNNRGSSGYGKTFYHLDDRKHGEGDLQDCIFGRKYLEKLDWVDGSHVGIMGGSYGGFMVAAALTLQPKAFDVGVDLFGVTNWVRTLKSIPPWWAASRDSLYAEMGDPVTDEERLTRISPLFHADRIERPMIVLQGANDPRVLQAESDELVAGAKKNGVPVDYVIFPDEGHGFLKKENRITSASKILAFLDKYLRAGKGTASGQ